MGQRGTHGAFLRAPQRFENPLCSPFRGETFVYRHRHRTVSVRAGGHELGVAREVARVTPHRPALSVPAIALNVVAPSTAPPATTNAKAIETNSNTVFLIWVMSALW